MARTSGDGDVILEVGFDEKGIRQGVSKSEKEIDKLGGSLKRMSSVASSAFKAIFSNSNGIDKMSIAIKKQENLIAELEAKYKAFASGDITPTSLKQIEAEIKRLQLEYDKLEKQAVEAQGKMKNLDIGLDTPELAQATAEFDRLAKEIDTISPKLFGLKEKAENLRINPSGTIEAKKLAGAIGVARDKLEQMNKEAASSAPSKGLKDMSEGFKKVTKESSAFTQKTGVMFTRLKGVVLSAFIFNGVSSALRSLTEQINAVIKTNTNFMKSISQTKGNLAVAFQPIIDVVMPILNVLGDGLVYVSSLFAQFMALLSGKSIAQLTKSAKALNAQTKAMKNSAKATKGQTAAFDELIVLSEKATDSTDSAGGIATEEIGSGITISPQLQEIIDRIIKLFEPLKAINLDNIINAFNNLKSALEPFVKIFFEGLEWFWYNILVPFAKWTIEDLIPAFLNLLAAAIRALNVVLEVLKPFGIWLWENFLKPLAEFTGGIIISVIEGLTTALNAFSAWASDNKEIVQAITTTLLGFFAGMWVYSAAKNIGAWIMGTLVPAFTKLIASITSIGFSSTMAAGAFGILAAGIIYLAANWNKLNGAQQVITILGALAAAAIAAAIAIAFFHTAWSVGIAAAAIVAGIALIAGTTLFTMSNAKVPSMSGDVSQGDLSKAQSFGNGTNFMKSPLPALATGAVLPPNKPFMAMVGDQRNGTNIEAPLDTIVNAVSIADAGTNERIIALLEQIRDKENAVELDGDKISKTVIGNINNTFQRTGRMPIGAF